MNTDNIDFLILKNEPIVIGMILFLFVSFGVVIDGTYRIIDRHVPDPSRRVNVVYYVFSTIGLFFVVAAFVALFTSEGCDCERPVGVAWSMTVAAVGTITWWAYRLIANSPRWLITTAAVLGYSGTAGVLVFGLIRALSDASEIIS